MEIGQDFGIIKPFAVQFSSADRPFTPDCFCQYSRYVSPRYSVYFPWSKALLSHQFTYLLSSGNILGTCKKNLNFEERATWVYLVSL